MARDYEDGPDERERAVYASQSLADAAEQLKAELFNSLREMDDPRARQERAREALSLVYGEVAILVEWFDLGEYFE